MNDKKSMISLIVSMAVFGTIGIFRRNIDLSSELLALSRAVIGTAFLLLVVLLKKEKINFKAIKRNAILLVVSGAFIGFNWILLFEAYCYTSVATATLCYYMAPIMVILASPFVLKEKLTVRKLLCVGAALVGMVFVSGILKVGFTGVSEIKGVLFGLGAAVLYASIIMMNKKFRDISAYEKTIVQLGVSAVTLLPYTLITQKGESFAIDIKTLIPVLIVGIIHTGIAYALYFGSMGKIKAQTVALYSYIDPVLAIILSAVLLKEPLGVFEMIGAVMILGAAVISDRE